MATVAKKTLTKKQLAAQKLERQKKRVRQGQIRDRDIVLQYRRKSNPVHLDNMQWKLTCTYVDGLGVTQLVDLGPYFVSVSWSETEEVAGITGTLSLQRNNVPHNIGIPASQVKKEKGFQIGDGHMVRLECFWLGRWREVWRMRIWKPSEDYPAYSGTYDLADDMRMIGLSKSDYEYKKSKKRPKGWALDQAIRDVCAKNQIALGRCPKGKVRIKNTTMTNATPLAVIQKLLGLEKEETGIRYILRWQNGKLYITPLMRQPLLYTFQQQIETATVSHERDPQKFYTAIDASGTYTTGGKDKKGKKKKKFELRIVHTAAARRYGLIVIKKKYTNSDSLIEAKRRAQRDIAETIRSQTQPTISLTHQGIPFIRRGDAAHVLLAAAGYADNQRQFFPATYDKKGKRTPDPKDFRQRKSILFVSSITHSLSPGNYTMDPQFTVDDPVAKYHDELRAFQDKKKRKEKSTKRKAKAK